MKKRIARYLTAVLFVFCAHLSISPAPSAEEKAVIRSLHKKKLRKKIVRGIGIGVGAVSSLALAALIYRKRHTFQKAAPDTSPKHTSIPGGAQLSTKLPSIPAVQTETPQPIPDTSGTSMDDSEKKIAHLPDADLSLLPPDSIRDERSTSEIPDGPAGAGSGKTLPDDALTGADGGIETTADDSLSTDYFDFLGENFDDFLQNATRDAACKSRAETTREAADELKFVQQEAAAISENASLLAEDKIKRLTILLKRLQGVYLRSNTAFDREREKLHENHDNDAAIGLMMTMRSLNANIAKVTSYVELLLTRYAQPYVHAALSLPTRENISPFTNRCQCAQCVGVRSRPTPSELKRTKEEAEKKVVIITNKGKGTNHIQPYGKELWTCSCSPQSKNAYTSRTCPTCRHWFCPHCTQMHHPLTQVCPTPRDRIAPTWHCAMCDQFCGKGPYCDNYMTATQRCLNTLYDDPIKEGVLWECATCGHLNVAGNNRCQKILSRNPTRYCSTVRGGVTFEDSLLKPEFERLAAQYALYRKKGGYSLKDDPPLYVDNEDRIGDATQSLQDLRTAFETSRYIRINAEDYQDCRGDGYCGWRSILGYFNDTSQAECRRVSNILRESSITAGNLTEWLDGSDINHLRGLLNREIIVLSPCGFTRTHLIYNIVSMSPNKGPGEPPRGEGHKPIFVLKACQANIHFARLTPRYTDDQSYQYEQFSILGQGTLDPTSKQPAGSSASVYEGCVRKMYSRDEWEDLPYIVRAQRVERR